MSYFIIIRGPAGIGKTTISKEIAKLLNGYLISFDNILKKHGLDFVSGDPLCVSEHNMLEANKRIIPTAQEKLESEQIVIFEGNFYHKTQIDDLITQLQFPYMVYNLKADLDECIARNKMRNNPLSEQSVGDVFKLVSRFDYGDIIYVNGLGLHECVQQIRERIELTKCTESNSLTMHHQIDKQTITEIIALHFNQDPKFIKRITIGICNEVYEVGLKYKEVIVRLSLQGKYLMGSHDHIPKIKSLGIKVPDILAEDYSKTKFPFSYQIQNKIEGQDLGCIINTLSDEQLKILAKEIVAIFNKIKTISTNGKFGVIWGGGENDISNTWTERMRIWIDESITRGNKTGIMNKHVLELVESLYSNYKSYFGKVRPVTYFGDICSKNVMINNGVFNGLVDLDGLTQGDPLEAIGRIKLSWNGTRHGEIYTNAIMDEMRLTMFEREIVTAYALLNQVSWMCENGIQFNKNTIPVVDKKRERTDKELIKSLSAALWNF